MLGGSAYDILDLYDHPLAAGVVPIAPYNPRNTEDLKDIEYWVEVHIEEASEDVQLKPSILDETFNRRTGVERTNDVVKDFGLGHGCARAASTHEKKCSLRSAYGSSLQSPTTREATIREMRNSSYETNSMTRSVVKGGADPAETIEETAVKKLKLIEESMGEET
jgi:hypothetical protein